MAILDTVDAIVYLPFGEFRVLPPNRFRIRVGVGNRILFNQAQFLSYGVRTWDSIFSRRLADTGSSIVEIGCGCGRSAHALTKFGFHGRYIGIDVDHEMIEWCLENLASDHLAFEHADVRNSVYNPSGQHELYRLPVDDGTQDLVFSQSLFTHLLQEELSHYIRESARVLRPGCVMTMSVFCVEDMQEAGILGGRWTFSHRIGEAQVERPDLPEAAVAYKRDFLFVTCLGADFSEVQIVPGDPQSSLFCRR